MGIIGLGSLHGLPAWGGGVSTISTASSLNRPFFSFLKLTKQTGHCHLFRFLDNCSSSKIWKTAARANYAKCARQLCRAKPVTLSMITRNGTDQTTRTSTTASTEFITRITATLRKARMKAVAFALGYGRSIRHHLQLESVENLRPLTT